MTNSKSIHSFFGYNGIKSPLPECKDELMILGIASGRSLIGSVVDEDNDRLVVSFPMIYNEGRALNPETGQPLDNKLQMMIIKQFHILPVARKQLFRFDTIYLFNEYSY